MTGLGRETSATPTVTPSATVATPKVVKRTVTETRRVPYKTRRVEDSGLAEGTTRVRASGRAGVKTLTYEVTYLDRDGDGVACD